MVVQTSLCHYPHQMTKIIAKYCCMSPKNIVLFLVISVSIYLNACKYQAASPPIQSQLIQGKGHFIHDFPPTYPDGDIRVLVEIPTGTLAKWEVDKNDGNLHWEKRNGKHRVVQYLGYPGNYGMIPQTLLPKSAGGDGDPLDVLVLGAAVARGTWLKCRLIGVLQLLDNGEQDDKLIAVAENSPFYDVQDITDLETHFTGVRDIIQLWFGNYKGKGEMQVQGFGNTKVAHNILQTAIQAYK